METMKFYYVDPKYLEQLRDIEKRKRGFSKVPDDLYGSRKRKFFCGPVLEIHGCKYYAPVSSNTTTSPSTCELISRGKVLSTIRTSYMIPVPDCMLHMVDFRLEDSKYRDLLENEYELIKKNQIRIRTTSRNTYRSVCEDQNIYSIEHSCDFQLLEGVVAVYDSIFNDEGMKWLRGYSDQNEYHYRCTELNLTDFHQIGYSCLTDYEYSVFKTQGDLIDNHLSYFKNECLLVRHTSMPEGKDEIVLIAAENHDGLDMVLEGADNKNGMDVGYSGEGGMDLDMVIFGQSYKRLRGDGNTYIRANRYTVRALDRNAAALLFPALVPDSLKNVFEDEGMVSIPFRWNSSIKWVYENAAHGVAADFFNDDFMEVLEEIEEDISSDAEDEVVAIM